MPLFGRHNTPPPAPVVQEPPRKTGLFSRHHEPAPVVAEPRRHSTTSNGGGFFGRRRSSSISPPRTAASSTRHSSVSTRHSSVSSSGTRHRSLLHSRNAEDPSIVGARERVYAAEAAERDADKALMGARTAVKDARDHVKRLEREAAEDARLALLKQNQAASISKRAKPLGRHGL